MSETRISQDEFLYCWNQEDQERVYSCPHCRQTFSPRPALARNTMLAEVVEKTKKTKLPADCDAGARDVQCDVCTGRKYRAVKSCLVCLNSYCQNHLEQHESWFKGKRHNLTEATGRLQEMICQKHEKILEVFCRTDQKCICGLCMIIEHKNHDIVSAADQRTEKQVFKTRRFLQRGAQEDLRQRNQSIIIISYHAEHLSLRNGCRIMRITLFMSVDFHSHIHQHCSQEEERIPAMYVSKKTMITNTGRNQSYPDHPDRFDVWQVLCRESVYGRWYWEIEWSGDYGVCISVSYKSISRKGEGNECLFGYNDQSWSLICSFSSYSFRHNKIMTFLPVKPISSRVGVFVDHSAGTLSFYSVSDTVSLIHTVQTTFTQPLYPGFYVFIGSSVKLCSTHNALSCMMNQYQ
uniref:Tripartite motif-containing protein 16-like n=1 Tax=Cyprinus carpio TaxID=7962 RepID=A0A8C2JS21_CYPCA